MSTRCYRRGGMKAGGKAELEGGGARRIGWEKGERCMEWTDGDVQVTASNKCSK